MCSRISQLLMLARAFSGTLDRVNNGKLTQHLSGAVPHAGLAYLQDLSDGP
jgi:hypothetical protein